MQYLERPGCCNGCDKHPKWFVIKLQDFFCHGRRLEDPVQEAHSTQPTATECLRRASIPHGGLRECPEFWLNFTATWSLRPPVPCQQLLIHNVGLLAHLPSLGGLLNLSIVPTSLGELNIS